MTSSPCDVANSAMLTISTCANSTLSSQHVLRLMSDAFNEPALLVIAEELGHNARSTTTPPAIVQNAVRRAAQEEIETTSERWAREGAELLAEYDALGGGSNAASKIAQRHFRDQPRKRDNLERRVRDLVLKREKRRTSV